MNATTLNGLDPATAEIFGVLPAREMPGRYGARHGPNWLAVTLILLAHVALLAALIKLDVIRVTRTPPQPLVMTLVPEQAPPPPEAAPPPPDRPDTPMQPVVVAPTPVVQTPAPAPAIATTPVSPPPAPVAQAADPAPPAPVAAPITPPSASAATLNNPAPRYPMDARRRKQEGTVRLRVVITVEGRVKEISVARSSGVDSLDEAALDAVRRWKFVPGMQAGKPVEAVGFVPIPFRLT